VYTNSVSASVASTPFAPETVKKLPRYPVVPAALLARLAVAEGYQGKGLGGVLLSNAILRAARVELGVFAVLVDAKDEAAQRFYEHYGFTLLPGVERRLCLPIAVALRQFQGRPEQPS
jgi:GNAT superfamily N-acetyltransferase